MMSTLILKLGPAVAEIDEVIIGSEMRFSVYVRQKTGPGVYVPFDFTGYTLLGHMKRRVLDVDPLEILDLTAPGASGAGYVDIVLSSTQTTALGVGKFVGSVKMWPTGDEPSARTIVKFTAPLVHAATG